MVIYATGGGLGTGKTAALTYLAFLGKFKHNAKIYSNYNISFGDEVITSISQLDAIRDGRVFLDELWIKTESWDGVAPGIVLHSLNNFCFPSGLGLGKVWTT